MDNTMTLTKKVALIHSFEPEPDAAVNILLTLQQATKDAYVDEASARLVADYVGLTLANIYELVSYYPALNEQPQARYVLTFCHSAPCAVSDNGFIEKTLHQILGIDEGQVTDDGLLAYQGVACVGACEQAPFIKIKDHIFPNLTTDKIQQLVADLKAGHFDDIL
ncbi:NAD(P)H-dependent oxidoreductase subunit E [Agrilactobacillus yilanensis]|uniref:NAD(P)H-dependent oxidoreductase subunit E n=1 Tax=Agrilactobacillus yilanensis TaxID=2485997 RepID=A0ABW4J9B3_9LACO|nr:NAD(P)H-dependent oxidoreductase subunit E [Agrilactobacillus yilanensis]